jgi:FAD:protein FMN transferase
MTLVESRAPSTPTAWEWRATGTRWRIHHGGSISGACAARAVELVAADEARWSRFRADSEVARLTRAAGRFVPVSAETYALLDACAHWQSRSGGLFQPLVGRALGEWGYARGLAERPAGVAHRPSARRVGGEIELEPVSRMARIPHGAELDLGGIAKGWMAARLGRWLVRATADPLLLVDAGGDILAVRGHHLVAVDHGDGKSATLGRHAGRAVATSGGAARSWVNGDGTSAHHLIDPTIGAPAAASVATVIATDLVTADVLATVLALDPAGIARLRRPALVTCSGGQRGTPAWDALVRAATVPFSEDPDNGTVDACRRTAASAR